MVQGDAQETAPGNEVGLGSDGHGVELHLTAPVWFQPITKERRDGHPAPAKLVVRLWPGIIVRAAGTRMAGEVIDTEELVYVWPVALDGIGDHESFPSFVSGYHSSEIWPLHYGSLQTKSQDTGRRPR